MNRSLHQLFIAVIALFLVLVVSTSSFMVFRADELNADARNTRALYHEFAVPRGAITASDGTILAQSVPSKDAFQYQRQYPQPELYAPITGYFSVVSRAGKGIESSENSVLTGETDSLWLQKLKSAFTGQANQGATIETSINTKLQNLAYQSLQGKTGAVVALEPSTGRILAMASTPSYNPNDLATHDTKAAAENYSNLAGVQPSPLNNNAMLQVGAPGSMFKIIVSAAAFESGEYNPDSIIPAPLEWTLPGTNYKLPNAETWMYRADGQMPMREAFAWSSNTAFAQLGVKLGYDKVNEIATKLGFGTQISVDRGPGSNAYQSVKSLFPKPASDDKLALQSIGQGDTVATPLQMAMVSAAVANSGTLMRPTLVDTVRSSDLSVISQTSPSILSHPFSSDTASKLNEMMQVMITTAWPALKIPGVKVAAKTGTAQSGTRNQFVSGWITGFAPADNPKIAVCVWLQDIPSLAGDTSGPIMKSLMEAYLK